MQMKRAGEDRETENKDFHTVIADQRVAQKLLKASLTTLQVFYGETPPWQRRLEGPPPPAGFIGIVTTIWLETLVPCDGKGRALTRSCHDDLLDKKMCMQANSVSDYLIDKDDTFCTQVTGCITGYDYTEMEAAEPRTGSSAFQKFADNSTDTKKKKKKK